MHPAEKFYLRSDSGLQVSRTKPSPIRQSDRSGVNGFVARTPLPCRNSDTRADAADAVCAPDIHRTSQWRRSRCAAMVVGGRSTALAGETSARGGQECRHIFPHASPGMIRAGTAPSAKSRAATRPARFMTKSATRGTKRVRSPMPAASSPRSMAMCRLAAMKRQPMARTATRSRIAILLRAAACRGLRDLPPDPYRQGFVAASEKRRALRTRHELLDHLVRFELTADQFLDLLSDKDRLKRGIRASAADVVANPYLLCEQDLADCQTSGLRASP